MVSQNRILTVSYGTFSCTLEGFDDPFGTMKAIAEYFRDLAAEDRYFGAEPPQPDAAMLHRIAEREIQRRVEAKIQDNGNGVILRAAAEAPALTDSPARVPMVEPVSEPDSDSVPEPVQPEPVRLAEPVASAASDPEPIEPGAAAPRLRAVDEGVAAKLARIRAAVGRGRTPMAPGPVLAEDDEDESPAALLATADFDVIDLPVDAPITAAAELAPVVDADQVARMVAAISGATEARGEVADALADDAADWDDEAESDLDLDHDDELGAVEPAAIVLDPAEPSALAEEPLAASVAELPAPPVAEPVPQVERRALAWARRHRRAARAAQAAAAAEATSAPVPEENVAPAALEDLDLDALEATFEGLEAEAAAEAAALPLGQLPEPTPTPEPMNTLDAAEQAQPEPDLSAILGALDTAVAPSEARQESSEAAADVDASLSALSQADATPPQGLRQPRVIRVRRVPAQAAALPAADDIDLDALQRQLAEDSPKSAEDSLAGDLGDIEAAEVTLSEVLETVLAAPAAPAPASGDLTDEDDDVTEAVELPAEPAAFDAEITTASSALPVQPARRSPVRPVPQRPATQRPVTPRPGASAAASMPVAARPSGEGPSRPARPERSTTPRPRPGETSGKVEVPVDRLLRQADSEMSDAGTQRRTSTIAHLKAAVAATVADRLSPQGAGDWQADDTAIYRNDLADAVQHRPDATATAARVAPLVLVSAQRIDTATAAALPLRPRRVSGAALALDPIEAEDFDSDAEDARDNLFGGAGSLAEYLIRQGHGDLADRMEATAAWLVAVEGREEFNRPLLMRMAAIDEAADTREDAMIAFGALLREGRITRSRRGQFTLPETSAALAEARRFAG